MRRLPFVISWILCLVYARRARHGQAHIDVKSKSHSSKLKAISEDTSRWSEDVSSLGFLSQLLLSLQSGFPVRQAHFLIRHAKDDSCNSDQLQVHSRKQRRSHLMSVGFFDKALQGVGLDKALQGIGHAIEKAAEAFTNASKSRDESRRTPDEPLKRYNRRIEEDPLMQYRNSQWDNAEFHEEAFGPHQDRRRYEDILHRQHQRRQAYSDDQFGPYVGREHYRDERHYREERRDSTRHYREERRGSSQSHKRHRRSRNPDEKPVGQYPPKWGYAQGPFGPSRGRQQIEERPHRRSQRRQLHEDIPFEPYPGREYYREQQRRLHHRWRHEEEAMRHHSRGRRAGYPNDFRDAERFSNDPYGKRSHENQFADGMAEGDAMNELILDRVLDAIRNNTEARTEFGLNPRIGLPTRQRTTISGVRTTKSVLELPFQGKDGVKWVARVEAEITNDDTANLERLVLHSSSGRILSLKEEKGQRSASDTVIDVDAV